jgi:4-methyl-5(b-hydroxyethyl)-thiazole monophosphate biosynthesis
LKYGIYEANLLVKSYERDPWRRKNMKILMPLAEGFEEIEAITVIDILRRADIEVVVAGLKDGLVEGAHRVKVQTDVGLDRIDPSRFDGLVLPGGFPGYVNLERDDRVLNMAKQMNAAGKYIAAICCAPSVLIKAGILQGKRATVSPSGKALVAACAKYSEERVVVDGKLVTSQSPGTAMEFALTLVKVLAGEEKMKQIKQQTLAIWKEDGE